MQRHPKLSEVGVAPERFDLIWPLGFGRLATWFDRMQMLASLPEQQFVVSPRQVLGFKIWEYLLPSNSTN